MRQAHLRLHSTVRLGRLFYPSNSPRAPQYAGPQPLRIFCANPRGFHRPKRCGRHLYPRCTKHEGERGLKGGSLRHIHARSCPRFRRGALPNSLQRVTSAATGRRPSGGVWWRNLAGIVSETAAAARAWV